MMFAEELMEKNELIVQLQSSIKIYEEKYETSGNVLEDDIMSLKKEVESLEKLKDRFENEMIKSNDKVQMNKE